MKTKFRFKRANGSTFIRVVDAWLPDGLGAASQATLASELVRMRLSAAGLAGGCWVRVGGAWLPLRDPAGVECVHLPTIAAVVEIVGPTKTPTAAPPTAP